MNVIDLLITIIIVTILVTIGLGVVTYIAYKLRLARRPAREDEEGREPRYFRRFEPPASDDGGSRGVESPLGAGSAPGGGA
ncbi:MAG TPA: hypothetical protein VKA44_03530 [Gemmatimonadota bacterium]|nr:hypothetical protein [Gemmatimonadota bacterium]